MSSKEPGIAGANYSLSCEAGCFARRAMFPADIAQIRTRSLNGVLRDVWLRARGDAHSGESLRMNQKAFQIRPALEAVTSCDYVLGVGKSRMIRVL